LNAQNTDGILLMSQESWDPKIKLTSRTNFYIPIPKFNATVSGG